MKKTLITLSILFFSLTLLESCRDTTEKEVVIEKEQEDNEGVLEKAGKEVDKEVNEEVDETIEDIGDDN
jgi:hypothetical protein